MHTLSLSYRFKLRPRSTWGSPLDSDFLSGLMCVAAARLKGSAYVADEIVGPALEGRPRFVLSSALPGDLLPTPLWIKHRVPELEATPFMTRAAFLSQVKGELPSDTLVKPPIQKPIRRQVINRNLISRGDSTAGAYEVSNYMLTEEFQRETNYLSIYVALDALFLETFREILGSLCETGIGRGASIGMGQFAVEGLPERTDWIFKSAVAPNAMISLSTFQPSATDKARGYWELAPKAGFLAADLLGAGGSPVKRPLLLCPPGTTLESNKHTGFCGRAVPSVELLDCETHQLLKSQGHSPVHYAFGLAVPCKLPAKDYSSPGK